MWYCGGSEKKSFNRRWLDSQTQSEDCAAHRKSRNDTSHAEPQSHRAAFQFHMNPAELKTTEITEGPFCSVKWLSLSRDRPPVNTPLQSHITSDQLMIQSRPPPTQSHNQERRGPVRPVSDQRAEELKPQWSRND